MAVEKKTNHVVFILSFGRPKKVKTLRLIQRLGYTGDWYIVCSDDDDTIPEYKKLYGDKVLVFNKDYVASKHDTGDNFDEKRCVFFARNICRELAIELGYKHFIQLDDDYEALSYRINDKGESISAGNVLDMDALIEDLIEYLDSTNLTTVAIAQNGDYIGGFESDFDGNSNRRRKAMNFFVMDVDKPYNFVGRINEDVNTYVRSQQLGNVTLTFALVSLKQTNTQQSTGGMSDMYQQYGTYFKSFYTVMYNPSCVKIRVMQTKFPRLHHSISWDNAVPVIISDGYKKKRNQ